MQPSGFRGVVGAGYPAAKSQWDLGLSQAQLAEALGVNAGTVITWEKNRQEPSGRRLLGIIRFLGYDPRAG